MIRVTMKSLMVMGKTCLEVSLKMMTMTMMMRRTKKGQISSMMMSWMTRTIK